MPTEPQPVDSFPATGLLPALLEALDKAKFLIPTPIQAAAIPVALTGRDLTGIAQTGTGKTMAFALPILNSLLEHPEGNALIIVPTRELALQVEASIRTVTKFLHHAPRTLCLIGGQPIYRQIKDLRYDPSILVVTPGHLNDHLEQKTVHLNSVKFLVLDEADRMLDMGFAPQIRRIVDAMPATRQTMLFSATMAPDIARITNEYQTDPQRIEVDRSGENNAQIDQQLLWVSQAGKMEALYTLLQKYQGTVLVFSRTKHGASRLAEKLEQSGISAAEIHADRSLGQRRQALDGFKSGRYRVLVATDVAARGIDVKDITLVVNYDLPDAAEDYVHRIGRTGRNGQTGLAISFAAPDQLRDVQQIERLTGKKLELAEGSDSSPAAPSYASSNSRRRNSGPQRSSGPQGGQSAGPPRRSYGNGRGGGAPRKFYEGSFG